MPNLDANGIDRRDTFDIVFNPVVTAGQYTLRIGEDITDLAGNKMNQNGNGVNGESSDAYVQQAVLSTSTPAINMLARIAGTAFHDINADGVRQAYDPVVSGRTVYLDLNNNGVLDGGEPSRVTDAAGRFDFGLITSGTYSLREQIYGGYTFTGAAATTGNYTINLAGLDKTANDMGHRFNSNIIPLRNSTLLHTVVNPNPNAAFVINTYIGLLNRQPTPTELSNGLAAVGAGSSAQRSAFATNLFNSTEHLTILVNQLFQRYLKRAATGSEISSFSSQIISGISLEWLSIVITTSPEYNTLYASDAAYITAIYRDLLNRDPSAADLNHQVNNNLAKGVSRFTIAHSLVTSGESYSGATQSMYVQFLHRFASGQELNSWVANLQPSRVTLKQVAEIILASDEFYIRSRTAAG